MDVLAATVVIFALVAVAAALGMWWQHTNGKVKHHSPTTRVSPASSSTPLLAPANDDPSAELAPLLEFGRTIESESSHVAQPERPMQGKWATLVQFSSDMCGSCAPARRTLNAVASQVRDVSLVEVNLSEHTDLAHRYGLLTTPTIFIFDRAGRLHGRISGAPRKKALHDELTQVNEVLDVINA